jgi:arylsulfatase A-like enzyme
MGIVDPRLVANIDIASTVMDAVAIKPSTELDGRSLIDPAWSRERLLIEYWQIGSSRPWASTRTPTHQYMEYYDVAGEVTFREYYDLRSDPWQLRNLFEDRVRGNDPSSESLEETLDRDRLCLGNDAPNGCP